MRVAAECIQPKTVFAACVAGILACGSSDNSWRRLGPSNDHVTTTTFWLLGKKHSLGAVYLARGAQRVVSWGHLVAQPVVRKPETPNGSLSPGVQRIRNELRGGWQPVRHALDLTRGPHDRPRPQPQRLLKLPLWGVRFFWLIAVN